MPIRALPLPLARSPNAVGDPGHITSVGADGHDSGTTPRYGDHGRLLTGPTSMPGLAKTLLFNGCSTSVNEGCRKDRYCTFHTKPMSSSRFLRSASIVSCLER